jgi:hypothetical protein
MGTTSLILGVTFTIFDTIIFLYYGVSFWLKIRKEHQLIIDSKAVYKDAHLWNFIKAFTFAVLPIMLVYCVVSFSLINVLDSSLMNYLTSFGYAFYTVFVLIYLLVLSFGLQGILIALYKDSVIMMNVVIKTEQIYAIDFNNSRKHVYLNYVTDDQKKEMIKLKNKKTLLTFLENNFKKDLFVY